MLALRWFVLVLGLGAIVAFAEFESFKSSALTNESSVHAKPMGGTLSFIKDKMDLTNVVAYRSMNYEPDPGRIEIIASPAPVPLGKWCHDYYEPWRHTHVQLICSRRGKIESARMWVLGSSSASESLSVKGWVKVANGRCQGEVWLPDEAAPKVASSPAGRGLFQPVSPRLEFDLRFDTPLLTFDLPSEERVAATPALNTAILKREGKEVSLSHVVAVPADAGEEGENSVSVIASSQPISVEEFVRHGGSEWTHPYALITFNAAGDPVGVEYHQSREKYFSYDWEPSRYAPHGYLRLVENRCRGRAWSFLSNDSRRNEPGFMDINTDDSPRDEPGFDLDINFDVPLTAWPVRHTNVAGLTQVARKAIQDALDAERSHNSNEEIWCLRVDHGGRSAGWAKINRQENPRDVPSDVQIAGSFEIGGRTYKLRDVVVVDSSPSDVDLDTISVFTTTKAIPNTVGFSHIRDTESSPHPLSAFCPSVQILFSKSNGRIRRFDAHWRHVSQSGFSTLGSMKLDSGVCEGRASSPTDEELSYDDIKFDFRFRSPISRNSSPSETVVRTAGILEPAGFKLYPTLKGIFKSRDQSSECWNLVLRHNGPQLSAVFRKKPLDAAGLSNSAEDYRKADDQPPVPCAVKLNKLTGEAHLLRATADGKAEWVPIKDE